MQPSPGVRPRHEWLTVIIPRLSHLLFDLMTSLLASSDEAHTLEDVE